MMDILKNIKTCLRTPSIPIMKCNKLLNRQLAGEQTPGGIDIFSEDWDTLIILDACRHDVFAHAVDFDGSYETRVSQGTSTAHFLRSNFDNRELHDTVYVSSNGWILRLNDELGTELHDLTFLDDPDQQDDETGATRPEAVTEEAIEYARRYPNKRLIVHYVQPHIPYIGEFGREVIGDGHGTENLMKIMASGDVSESALKRAYRENLDVVLPHVGDLLAELDGKSVITADHGELLGERVSPIPIKGYGHPDHIYHPALTTVPWFVCEYDSRRKITSDRPTELEDVDEEQLTEQLKTLGYAV